MAEDKELFIDFAQAFGMAIFETLRCSFYTATHPNGGSINHTNLSNTDDLQEKWGNAADKFYDFMEVNTP